MKLINQSRVTAWPVRNNTLSTDTLLPSGIMSARSNSSITSKTAPATAWPVRNATLPTGTLIPSGIRSGRSNSSITSNTAPAASSTYNISSSSCCFVVQDTIDVRYWKGECQRYQRLNPVDLAQSRGHNPYHRIYDSSNFFDNVCHSVSGHHRRKQCFYGHRSTQSLFYMDKC